MKCIWCLEKKLKTKELEMKDLKTNFLSAILKYFCPVL